MRMLLDQNKDMVFPVGGTEGGRSPSGVPSTGAPPGRPLRPPDPLQALHLDDNPYSEAQFKTLKYHPGFPEHFGCAQDARIFCQDFFSWYNTEHRHSGIAYLTPDMVHHGNAGEVIQARQFVLLDAFAAHPERFVNKVPQPAALPESVWINPPKPSLEIEKKEVVLP